MCAEYEERQREQQYDVHRAVDDIRSYDRGIGYVMKVPGKHQESFAETDRAWSEGYE